jgi:hypothetical protein
MACAVQNSFYDDRPSGAFRVEYQITPVNCHPHPNSIFLAESPHGRIFSEQVATFPEFRNKGERSGRIVGRDIKGNLL